MGACFQAPRATPGQDRWKHFILDFLPLMGGDATHFSHHFFFFIFFFKADELFV